MLDRAARAYMNHLRAVRIVGNELVLSKVYSWYAVDFGGEAEVLHHFAGYASSILETKIMLVEGIDDYVYDWALNGTGE